MLLGGCLNPEDTVSGTLTSSWVYAGKDYRGWWKDILGLLHPRFVVYLRSVMVISTVHGGVLMSIVGSRFGFLLLGALVLHHRACLPCELVKIL